MDSNESDVDDQNSPIDDDVGEDRGRSKEENGSDMDVRMRMKSDDERDEEMDLRVNKEVLQHVERQREALLRSSHSLLGLGSPPTLLPPTALPYYASTLSQHSGLTPPYTSPQSTPSQTPTPTQDVSGSQQAWSFEEQFKQLYELSDDLRRKNFLDDLFCFMQKRGTPINRLPIMAKQVLDLYELYNLVIARGGLVEVINKKLWQEIIKGLKLPSSITSAAFTLRTQYMKYLYPYECEKQKLSSPSDLQAAIDGNRREGRRSSYGSYQEMTPRQSYGNTSLSSQISPLSLVTSRASLNGSSTPLSAMEEELMSRMVGNVPRFPPPQREALNLSDGSKSSESSRKDDSSPPPSKKLLLEEESAKYFMPPAFPSAHIKIQSRGDPRTGVDSSLVVCMEINGIMYQGVLFAQSALPNPRSRVS